MVDDQQVQVGAEASQNVVKLASCIYIYLYIYIYLWNHISHLKGNHFLFVARFKNIRTYKRKVKTQIISVICNYRMWFSNRLTLDGDIEENPGPPKTELILLTQNGRGLNDPNKL
jgi:hypothetical protein